MTVDQIIGMTLLDYLAYKTHCEYLSDLPRVSRWELIRQIEEIAPQAFSEENWREAIRYLTGTEASGHMGGCRETKQMLIHLLGGAP